MDRQRQKSANDHIHIHIEGNVCPSSPVGARSPSAPRPTFPMELVEGGTMCLASIPHGSLDVEHRIGVLAGVHVVERMAECLLPKCKKKRLRLQFGTGAGG
jgi:hypothetical protein